MAVSIVPKATILVVDDTPENLHLLSQELTAHGYEVRGVVNGEMALMVTQSAKIDLILLDIKMPGISGYEVCKTLKSQAQTKDIPVIFLSALDEAIDKVKAFAVGGIDYITKPFQILEVLVRIETQLALQAARAEILQLNAELEQRVYERTLELEKTNQNLLKEIAERERAEAELRRSEQRYASLATVAPVGILQTDANGHYVYVNDLWCQITGLSLENARGFAWTQAVHPDDRERVIAAWYDAAQHNHLFRMEYRFQRADGVVTWVLGQATAEKDSKGRVTGFVGTITDITERKQTEEALRHSQQTISNILASINDGFFSLDNQWCFSYLNATAAQLFRCDRESLLHRNIWQALPETATLEFYHQCQRAVAEKQDLTFEDFFPFLDAWFEVHAYPFAGGLSVYFRDITTRKQTEAHLVELEKLNEFKDEFLSNVSHELRSPITNIRMAAKMLEIAINSDRDKHTLQHYLKILQSEAKREADLVDDLLELSRLDSESYELELTRIYLPKLLSEILDAFADRITEKSQHLLVEVPPDLPELVTSQTFLERIIAELVNNACKYSPMEATIKVHAEASEHHLHLTVCNTGVEIPSSEYERIFEKFYRIPNSDPFKHGGTGLGLAILKRIINTLGASLSLISANNQTEFTVHFPLTTS